MPLSIMTQTGMLVVTNPNKFIKLIPRIRKEIKKTLYIQFFPERKLRLPDIKTVKQFSSSSYSSVVHNFYSNTVYFRELDVRVLLGSIRDPNLFKISTKKPIEVVYFDQLLNEDEMQRFLKNCVQNKTETCEVVALNDEGLEQQEVEPKSISEQVFKNVVLGGTFDRLHSGHKILLSEAVLRCTQKMTVGVTTTEMLQTKKLWELIEPCDVRIKNVRDFLEDVEPRLEYDIVPISDIYGPTKDDPSFELLVVSSETIGGGAKVNELRLKNNLQPLKVRSVNLLNDVKLDDEEEDKISSSNGRLRLLGTRIRVPEERCELPRLPYILGLTGGIASGKSSISERLKALGAGIVNCDQVAHDLYKFGEPGYTIIVNLFGKTIVTPSGEIDRKALGDIVFNKKEELNKLNNILWPAILAKSREIIKDLHKEGKNVIVIEAAVLLQAGWQKHCHEVWACVIPKEEAVKRLQTRNGLSKEEASARVSSQPSNFDYVSNAHLVLCTLWRPEYTQKQVERAWSELTKRLGL